MKSREEIMNMLEAFDLTGSFRDAGELAGCSHHTVAAYVAKRDKVWVPKTRSCTLTRHDTAASWGPCGCRKLGRGS